MGAELSPTRHEVVEGRDIFVFDGLVSDADLAAYVEALARAPFTRTEIAKAETAEYKHWVSELPLANVGLLPLWAPTERAVACARPGVAYCRGEVSGRPFYQSQWPLVDKTNICATERAYPG